MKYTKQIGDGPAMASEPAAAYGAAVESRPAEDCSKVGDDGFWDGLSEEQLRRMPGVYTIDEMREEIRKSEASGTISNEEALSRFARWGFTL